jgi:general secretion pathway protein E
MRVSVIPTTHGLRAAVRLPADLLQPRTLEKLALPPGVLAGLYAFARAEAGMLLVTGPAGSGKTTTIYALLQHIVTACPGVSVISLEDPAERDLPGVTQIEVQPHGELTYERALRSILRQDPQVLMLGEIRDSATASLAIQAALSGHRLIATLHAASAGGAIARLLEMRLEPYQISSALWGVVVQRLLRRRDASGAYRGRLPVAELAVMDAPLRQALLEQADADRLQGVVGRQEQFVPMATVAHELVTRGLTDTAEVERVLGANVG